MNDKTAVIEAEKPEESKSNTSVVMRAKTDAAAVAMLIEKALDMGRPVSELVDMQKEILKMRAIQSFNVSKQGFTNELTPVPKTKTATMPGKQGRNGWSYKYAPFDAIEKHIKPLCMKYGFSYSFTMRPVDGFIEAICKLSHVDGHSEEASFFAPVGDNPYISGVQNVAASNSFCKRQALSAVLGLTFSEGEDNENNIPRTPPAMREESENPAPPDEEENVENINDHKVSKTFNLASPKQVKMIRYRLDASQADETELCHEFKIDSVESLDRNKVDDVLAWIAGRTS